MRGCIALHILANQQQQTTNQQQHTNTQGTYGYWGGGGGSGGGIRLSAGGTITNYGTLTVRGGDGGGCPADGGSPGSGGGGGRIAVFAESLSDQGSIILEGGSMGPINGTTTAEVLYCIVLHGMLFVLSICNTWLCLERLFCTFLPSFLPPSQK